MDRTKKIISKILKIWNSLLRLRVL